MAASLLVAGCNEFGTSQVDAGRQNPATTSAATVPQHGNIDTRLSELSERLARLTPPVPHRRGGTLSAALLSTVPVAPEYLPEIIRTRSPRLKLYWWSSRRIPIQINSSVSSRIWELAPFLRKNHRQTSSSILQPTSYSHSISNGLESRDCPRQ